MPARKSRGSIDPGHVNFREAPDTVAFYRKRAGERRLSLSDYIRTLTARGAMTEAIDEFLGNLETALAQASAATGKTVDAGRSSGQPSDGSLPHELLRAIFACEFMLRETLGNNDLSLRDRSQEYAQQQIKLIMRGRS